MSDLKSLWESAERAVIAGDVLALERLLRENPQLMTQTPPAYVPRGPGSHYAGASARSMIASEHQFTSFEAFEEHLEAMNHKDLPVAQFEAAVEAVISGDVAALQRLLQARPELIRARSLRTHHATLLHYLGANGVEGWRQKTPKNAVQIAETLLQAGAEVDATADLYGGGATTLGLVATSIHPCLAGVVDALMETVKLLLERKAPIEVKDPSFDGTPLGWALYGWGESVPGAKSDAYYDVVALLVAAGGKVEPDWLADRGLDEKLRADVRMLAAFRGESPVSQSAKTCADAG